MGVDRNGHRLDRIMRVVAIRAVHMRGGWGWHGLHGRSLVRVPGRAMRAVRAAFRFKRFSNLVHDQMHGAQHVGQHMVRLDFQVVRFELDQHMPVAEVIGRAHQVKRRAMRCAMRDAQYGLRRCNDPDHGAVLPSAHPRVMPEPIHLAALLEVVNLGFYRGIMNKLDEIEAVQPASAGFVADMRALARQFQFVAMSRQLHPREAGHGQDA